MHYDDLDQDIKENFPSNLVTRLNSLSNKTYHGFDVFLIGKTSEVNSGKISLLKDLGQKIIEIKDFLPISYIDGKHFTEKRGDSYKIEGHGLGTIAKLFFLRTLIELYGDEILKYDYVKDNANWSVKSRLHNHAMGTGSLSTNFKVEYEKTLNYALSRGFTTKELLEKKVKAELLK